MEFSVFPCLADEHAATLWFGVTARTPPGPVTVRLGNRTHPLPGSHWSPLRVDELGFDSRDGETPFWYFRHRFDDLDSDRVYTVDAALSDGRGAQAVFRTLPTHLPHRGLGTPLRVDLRSCYSREHGVATARQSRAEEAGPPHLKIHCGDQVYLDLPWHEVAGEPQQRFLCWLDKYRANWSRRGGSFAEVLARGANLFMSDDHEFWNNYPRGAVYAPSTWTAAGRAASGPSARALFNAFQSDFAANGSVVQGFDIGPAGRRELSLRALDCRYDRGDDRFAAEADIATICAWLADLRCPGVLVLSQPLLEPAAGFFTRWILDAGLAEFPTSYDPLVEAIGRVRHDLLVLSGDIHCGRVSTVRLAAGKRLFEVVSSPVALGSPEYHADPPAAQFPVDARAGAAAPVVSLLDPPRVECDHHAILDFARQDAAVTVKVRFEPLGSAKPARPIPQVPEIKLL